MDKSIIRIILADDHPIVIEGINSLLTDVQSYDIEVVGTASNGQEVMEILRTKENPIDIVLLDLEMPKMDGIIVAQKICTNYPEVKVLIMSNYHSEAFVAEAARAKVSGYILKDVGKKEIISAIIKIYEGENYYSSKILKVLGDIAGRGNNPQPQLTKRETEVLRLIAQGLTTSEIAEKLIIAETTIHTHRNNLKDKVGAKNIKELVKYAVEKGFV